MAWHQQLQELVQRCGLKCGRGGVECLWVSLQLQSHDLSCTRVVCALTIDMDHHNNEGAPCARAVKMCQVIQTSNSTGKLLKWCL